MCAQIDSLTDSQIDAVLADMRAAPPAPVFHVECQRCDTLTWCKLENSRTAYHWEGEGEDPNAPVMLCSPCAAEHREYWDSMWAEYNSGRL